MPARTSHQLQVRASRLTEPDLRQEPLLADPLLTHARAVPGYGGFFLDGDGRPTVYLKDARQRGAAELVLAGTLGRLGAKTAQLQVKQADYDYLQLNEWFTRAVSEVLAVPGAVFADVDEGSNRVRLGVETAAAEKGVRGVLARLGVPGGAIVVERAEPFHLALTLRDKVIPRRGGVQISTGAGFCTLGFNTRAGSGFIITRSFITASHCTNVRGGVEGTVFHQPVVPNPIGTEAADPGLFHDLSLPCRAKVPLQRRGPSSVYLGVTSDLGGIARTTARSIADGPLTINAANPNFNITSELMPVQGVQVNKVGRSTGWTYARIGSTCIGVNVANSNITLFCQSRTVTGIVPGLVRPGDSGSPVFYWDGGSNAVLTGLLWGGNSSHTAFVFSPIAGIEGELGALRTF